MKFNWFESHSTGFTFNCLESQLSWDSIYLRFDWFEGQLSRDSVDLAFNSFEIQVIWDPNDVSFTWFEIQLISGSVGLKFRWCDIHLVSNSTKIQCRRKRQEPIEPRQEHLVYCNRLVHLLLWKISPVMLLPWRFILPLVAQKKKLFCKTSLKSMPTTRLTSVVFWCGRFKSFAVATKKPAETYQLR